MSNLELTPHNLESHPWNSPEVDVENSPLCFGSVAAVAARRDDVGEGVEVEIDDVLKGLCGGAVAETVGHGVGPCGVFGLQGEQVGDGVVPALWAAAPVLGPAAADAAGGALA